MKIFWLIMVIAALSWYILVTLYVSLKGVADIREMLKRLGERKAGNSESETDSP